MTDLEKQIDALANFIMAEIPGEPSQSQGAVDTAIRVMRTMQAERDALRAENERLRDEAKNAWCDDTLPCRQLLDTRASIDAARDEGRRAGLEEAAKVAETYDDKRSLMTGVSLAVRAIRAKGGDHASDV